MSKPTIHEYISRDSIAARTKELAERIDEQYKDSNPILVCVLKGAMPFFVELVMNITVPCEFDYVAVSSYESGTHSSGRVKFVADLSSSVEERDVIIVEDIVDTGRTVAYLQKVLEARGAQSLTVATLLDKPERRVVDVPTTYVGFEIENRFVVGFGMDYDEQYRHIPYVGILDVEQSG